MNFSKNLNENFDDKVIETDNDNFLDLNTPITGGDLDSLAKVITIQDFKTTGLVKGLISRT